MTDELRHLGNVSKEYQRKVDEFASVLTIAAEAEAQYKSARARHILQALANGEARSHAAAETSAEADEHVATLYRERLTTAAIAEAHKAKLHQLREQVQNGRTFAATGREIDKMHAEGRSYT